MCSRCDDAVDAPPSADDLIGGRVAVALAYMNARMATASEMRALASVLVSNMTADAAREAVIAMYMEIVIESGDVFVFLSPRDVATMMTKARRVNVHAEHEYPEMYRFHSTLVSLCATPWDCDGIRDMQRVAICYHGNMGETPRAQVAVTQLLGRNLFFVTRRRGIE
jgi:hypothetical protein